MASSSLDATKAKNVLRQVEFYFGDSNLPKDDFLKKTVSESEDGLVSLALICSFARMRGHLGLGELKPEEVPEETVLAVAETLRKSASLKLSEDGKKIGRSTEFPKAEVIERVDSRTVAASPFPYDVTIEDVGSFFGEHGKVNSVRLPRLVGDKREFCGTALIEFSEEEDAKKVLSADMVYAGAMLEMKPKKDFDAKRDKEFEAFEKNRANKDASKDSYPKGLIVAFKLKRIQPEGSTEQNASENVNEVLEKKTSEKADDNAGKPAEDVEKGNGENVEDCIEAANEKVAADQESEVKVTNGSSEESGEKKAGTTNNVDVVAREHLKEIFQKFGAIKFIDFRMGEESGYIRFEDPDAAIKARAEAVLTDDGGFIVKNHIATLEPLSGEAEKEYWSLLRGNQERFKENKGGYNRGRGRSNRGGRHFDSKRHRQSDSFDRRSNKAQKVGTDE